MRFEAIACITASWWASTTAIVLLPVATVASVGLFGPEMPLLVISILALTFSQLVLLSTARDTRALQTKLDELIRAIPEARDEIAGIENRPHD